MFLKLLCDGDRWSRVKAAMYFINFILGNLLR